MAIIHGRDIIVQQDGVSVAASKSCKITTSCDVVEVSSPSTGVFKAFRAGRKEWSVSVSYLVSSSVGLQLLRPGDTVTLKIVLQADANLRQTITGEAICTQCEVTATKGSLAQGSFQFKGTGPLG